VTLGAFSDVIQVSFGFFVDIIFLFFLFDEKKEHKKKKNEEEIALIL
jgi:hypothetical protein